MKNKTFKSLDEQIELLIVKGLRITDYEYTRKILLRENYFFINGYRHPFYTKDKNRKFMPGATFEELYSLFLFDRQIRNIIFKNILVIENNLKSVLSHVMSKNHGYREHNYLNHRNLTNEPGKARLVNDLIKKMRRQISVNSKNHTATNHYIRNYGFIPLWIAVKVLSFGLVGELFRAMKKEDQIEIADLLKTDVNKLLSYLPILSNYRNLTAHEDVCYDNKTQASIEDTKYHKLLYVPKREEEYISGKNDLFALFIIFKHVLTDDDFNLFMNEFTYELDILNSKIKSIDFNRITTRMGLPNNYKELARIKKNGCI